MCIRKLDEVVHENEGARRLHLPLIKVYHPNNGKNQKNNDNCHNNHNNMSFF